MQSFADIAKATSEQLLKLPGFGQVKVKRLKDAFDKPFRNSSTSAIPFQPRLTEPDIRASTPATEAPSTSKTKGKERAVDPLQAGTTSPSASQSRAR